MEVNEEGTEATVMFSKRKLKSSKEKSVFRADHQFFLFMMIMCSQFYLWVNYLIYRKERFHMTQHCALNMFLYVDL